MANQEEVTKTRELLKKQIEELEDRMVAMLNQEVRYPVFLNKISNLIKEMREIANG